MGKKKSTALMVLLTVVIAVLCAITVFPSFAIPGTVEIWNPAIMQFDFGSDLGGGQYAYYYPEGVMSETAFESEYELKKEEDKQEFKDSYKKHGSLYLSKDEDDGICNDKGEVSEDFKKGFNRFVEVVSARYAEKGYSDYQVAVVDDYALRVEVPASDVNGAGVIQTFAYTGELTIKSGTSNAYEVLEELTKKDAKITDYIAGFSATTQYDVAYLEVELTDKGESLIKSVKSTLSSTDSAEGGTGLIFSVGDNQIGYPVFQEYIDGDTIMIPEAQDSDLATVETYAIILNSALENGGFDFELSPIGASDIRSFEAVHGDNGTLLLYIAFAVILLALIIVPIVRQGRYGVVNAYVVLSYLIITGLCFAFISDAVFEFTLGSALVFLVGLLLVCALNNSFYQAIKKEFYLGKTVESSVKTGYRKCLFPTVDLYAILALGSIGTAIIGAAGLQTMALQALICFVAGAFCNLLWTFAVNFVFLSASKNKYKYFRFVREDDDDE